MKDKSGTNCRSRGGSEEGKPTAFYRREGSGATREGRDNEEKGIEKKYIGETIVRLRTHWYDHPNTDKKLSIYKFKQESRIEISKEDFEIMDWEYANTVKRKLEDAL